MKRRLGYNLSTSTPICPLRKQHSNHDSNDEEEVVLDDQDLCELEIDSEQAKPNPPKKYLTLEEVFKLYPMRSLFQMVNIYAIIQSYHFKKQELTVMDETRKRFHISVNLSLKLNGKSISKRVGNIVRIHHVGVFSDFSRRCNDIGEVTMFESFRDNPFLPEFIAECAPTFDSFDRERVKQLIELNVKRLLPAEIQSINRYSTIINGAFQVLCKIERGDTVILACWNGRPFNELPCKQLIQVEHIIQAIKSTSQTENVYTEKYIHKIYNDKKIIFITVYGMHTVVARALKPLDTIVIYKMLVKPDKYRHMLYCYTMLCGYWFGRCIRLADDKSSLAIALRKQIERMCLLDEDSFQLTKLQNDDNMTSDDDDGDEDFGRPSNKTTTTSIMLCDTLDDSSLNMEYCKIDCPHNQYDKHEREIIYEHLYSGRNVVNPSVALHVKSFSEMINTAHPTDNNQLLFRVEAKFYSVLFHNDSLNVFESMETFRKYAVMVECTSPCDYQDMFDNFMMESRDIYCERNGQLVYLDTENAKQHPTMDYIRCPRCQMNSCILCMNFVLVIQDYNRAMLVVKLSGLNANVLFGCSTSQLCSNDNVLLKKVRAMFQHLDHVTNHQTECTQKLIWTLAKNRIEPSSSQQSQPSQKSQVHDHYEYEVLAVSANRKAISCGAKMN